MGQGEGNMLELSVLSAQFFCKSLATLKRKSIN